MNQADIEHWLVMRVAEKARIEPQSIEIDQPIFAYGVDSAFAASLSAELADLTERELSPTLFFEFPSIEQVIRHLSTMDTSASHGHAGSAVKKTERSIEQDIAVVGIGCRMPGAPNKEAFWRALLDGKDCISTVPTKRWDAEALNAAGILGNTRVPTQGGFIDGIDEFDTTFFRIAPLEARHMDPQQRILLQVTWEALEDAGCVPSKIRGTRGGVFIGISNSDYGHRQFSDLTQISAFSGTGNALSIAANRLSYFYDLKGPSLAIDTACSSALAATHLALKSMWAGECDFALVGGVNLLISPEVTVGLAHASMLSPDARCRSFDADANGYVRGEGCGVVMLKPLSQAIKSGDRVYAVIKGSAVNQDGRSNGLTAPNPASQEQVLRDAYSCAGVDPSTVGFIETHGTGTPLGDPIEALALSRVLCAKRVPQQPLLIGSVKSNIGHLEAAAGMAGLIKAALILYHRTIPASLHFRKGNPKIDFDALRLKVVDASRAWPNESDIKVCGVSSFGFGGTNAHVVLQEGPHHAEVARASNARQDETHLVCLSAVTPAGLGTLVENWASWLGKPAGTHEHLSLKEIAYTSLARREHLSSRRAFIVKSKEQLLDQLRSFSADTALTMNKPLVKGRRVLFVYPGQGRHWANLGRELLDHEPLFRSVIRRCDEAAADGLLDWSIEEALRNGAADIFTDAVRAQPAIFAIQMGLTALLNSHGIEPSAVIGHSVGEIAAACASGSLQAAEGLRLAVKRGQAMALQSGDGATLAIAASEAEATVLTARLQGISIAAINGPGDITLAGDRAVLDAIYSERLEKGQASFWVNRSFAFHSHLMAMASSTLEQDVLWLTPRTEQCPFFSTVTGARLSGAELDASYWAKNIRETVLFAEALASALSEKEKFDAIIEISTQPVLQRAIRQVTESRGTERPALLSTLTKTGNAPESFFAAIKQLYEAGFTVRYRLMSGSRPGLVSLPAYAWSKDQYWIENKAAQRLPPIPTNHSLLGTNICNVPEAGVRVWATALDAQAYPSLLDHRIGGAVVIPAAAQMSMMIDALSAADSATVLQSGRFTAPLYLRDESVIVHTVIAYREKKPVSISICSKSQATDQDSVIHSSASVEPTTDTGMVNEHEDINAIRTRCTQPVESTELYALLSIAGLKYGPSFRLAREITVGKGEALARLDIPSDGMFVTDAFDPRLLDAAFHPLLVATRTMAGMVGAGFGAVPIGFDRFRFVRKPLSEAYAYVRVTQRSDGGMGGSVRLLAVDGEVLAAVDGLTFSEPKRAVIPAAQADVNKRLFSYESVWREWHGSAGAAISATDRYLVFADKGPVGDAMFANLAAQGNEHFVVLRSNRFHRNGRTFEIDPGTAQHYKRVLDTVCSEMDGKIDVILNLWLLDSVYANKSTVGTPSDWFEYHAVICLETIKAVTFAPTAAMPLLLFATFGVHSVPGGSAAFDPTGALAEGLAKALPFENPTMNCRCIDLKAGSPEELAGELLAESRLRDGETSILRWQGRRYVRRVVPTLLRQSSKTGLREDGTYIVTGGTGGIGPHILEWLAQRGARRIVYIGRRPRSPQVLAVENAIKATGVHIEYLSVDIADSSALRECFGERSTRFGPIRGVIHAAGVLADEPLLTMSAEQLSCAIRPKVNGLVNLMQHVPHDELDLVVLFSSAASVLGSPGQANYSAANAFLDAYVDMLHSKGVRAISASWGPWAEAGMAADRGSGIKELAGGLNFIRPADGIEALDSLLEHDYPHVMVLPFDLQNLVQHYPQGPGFSLFDELFDQSTVVLRSTGKTSGLASRPSLGAEYVAPRTDLERLLAGTWQRALGISQIGVHDSFFELGGDSVFGNQILVEISRQLGVTLNPESVFEQFTIAALAAHVEEKLLEDIEEMSETEAAGKLAIADAETSLRVLPDKVTDFAAYEPGSASARQ